MINSCFPTTNKILKTGAQTTLYIIHRIVGAEGNNIIQEVGIYFRKEI